MTQNSLPNEHDASRDFDFLVGQWNVVNNRKVNYLADDSEWEEFRASSHVQLLPAGIGNFDEFAPIDWRPGFIGMSLRIFNRQTQKWSIYWINNKTGGIDAATGQLEPAVVGGFEYGIGVFIGREVFGGVPVIVKFTWSDITLNSARWQQEFSEDDGVTWDLNWVMEMTRVTD